MARKGRPWLIDRQFAGAAIRARPRGGGGADRCRAGGRRADLLGRLRRRHRGEDPARCRPARACWCCRTTIPRRCWNGSTRAAAGGFTRRNGRASPATATGPRRCWPRSSGRVRAPVALASISSVHWSDGGAIDLRRIAPALRRAGRGAAGRRHARRRRAGRSTCAALDPDFLIFPTYKWVLGPYGRAFLYVAKRHQDGVPLEQTSYGRRGVARRAGDLFRRHALRRRRAPLRHGRARPFHLAGDGGDRHGDDGGVGPAAVVERLRMLTDRLADGLRDCGVRCRDAQLRAPHILSLGFPRGMPAGAGRAAGGRGTSTSRRGSAACASARTSTTTRRTSTGSSTGSAADS